MNLLKKIIGTWHKIRYNNPLVNGYYEKKRRETLNKQFLSSEAYDEIMTHASDSVVDFAKSINDAQEKSPNFIHRHMKYHKILGCWRWKALWQKKNDLIPVLFDENKIGIDFGGANGPVSYHAKVVDFATKDTFNRKVNFKAPNL